LSASNALPAASASRSPCRRREDYLRFQVADIDAVGKLLLERTERRCGSARVVEGLTIRGEGGCRIRAGESVKVAGVPRRREESLVLVLTVQVDHTADHRRQHRDRGHLTVDAAPGPALGAHPALYEHIAAVEREVPLDQSLGRSLADHRRVRPLAEQKLERFNEDRLAGARLTGEHGQAGAELQPDVLNECEVTDV
jgi:hypothetical protein